jgi:D-alanine-D-alanine ligase
MKPKIAFVTGGLSGEAEISYKSAITIENNVDKEKWDLYKIDINPQGWFYILSDGEKIMVDKEDFSVMLN